MENIKIIAANKDNDLIQIAKEFLLPYEKFCIQLFERLCQKDENVQIVTKEIGDDFVICGAFSHSPGGTVLPFFLEKDFDVEQGLKEYFSQRSVFCVSGEKSSCDFVVQCIESNESQKIIERREFIFMESNKKIDLPQNDDFIFRQCNKSDSDFLYPLQIAYIREEVAPGGIDVNLPAERFTMEKLLKDGKIFTVTDKIGKIICKAQINGQSDAYQLIGGVFTATNFRQQGYAKFMMENLIFNANKKNKTCVLFVNPKNIAAMKLYEKTGFVDRGRYEIVYMEK